MSIPSKPDQLETLGDVGADSAQPVVTWQEPGPLAYEVVELRTEDGMRPSLPPLDMVFRPHFADVPDMATPEEREQAAYRLAPSGPDLAAVHERDDRQARIQQLLAYSR